MIFYCKPQISNNLSSSWPKKTAKEKRLHFAISKSVKIEMPCQSYIVNPANKKDNSFRLFITFLVVVLLVFLLIYVLIVTLTQKKVANDEKVFYQNSSEKSKFDDNVEQLYTTSAEINENSSETSSSKFTTNSDSDSTTASFTTPINEETSRKNTKTSTEVFTAKTSKLMAEKFILGATKMAIIEENCQTSDCKKMAIDIMKNIDFSVDPCEDFHRFSCGNKIKQNSDIFEVLFDKNDTIENDAFANFFNSCLTYRNQFDSFDTLNQVLSIIIDRSSNLTTLLSFLLARQATPLFEIVDGKNGEIQLLPPGSYDTDILENWSLQAQIQKLCQTSQNFDAFKQCQSKKLSKMLKNLNSFKTNEKQTPDFDFLLNTIKQQISNSDIQEAIFKKSCQKIDILQLNKNYPSIDWQLLLKTISETTKPICIYFKADYFDPIMSDLDARNASEVIDSLKTYFQLQIYENLMAQKSEEFCMRQTVELMPEIAEKKFQQNVNCNELKLVFEEIKKEFYWLIEISKLKEDDKNLFKNKLKLLKIAFNDNKLEENYHDVNLTDSYLTKLFVLLENRRIIKEKSTKNSNFVDNDKIVIPYSFIYKTAKQDFSRKFHLGRAIAQYFNRIAQNEKNIFYQEFQKSLNANLENKFATKENWSKLVLASTFERTADNLALQIAFHSVFPRNISAKKLPWISEEFTEEQQFFLLIGQDICEKTTKMLPPKFRIDSMLTNSKNFAESFRCPEGSTMNPADEKIEFDQFEFDEEYEAADQIYK